MLLFAARFTPPKTKQGNHLAALFLTCLFLNHLILLHSFFLFYQNNKLRTLPSYGCPVFESHIFKPLDFTASYLLHLLQQQIENNTEHYP